MGVGEGTVVAVGAEVGSRVGVAAVVAVGMGAGATGAQAASAVTSRMRAHSRRIGKYG